MVPKTSFPRDRFDELTDDSGRVGAHRAENPRMRGGVVFLWAAIATVVLLAAGIFGTLVASGRVTLFPEPAPTQAPPPPAVEPVVDTTFMVLVLNATPQEGLATQTKDVIVAAGWNPDMVQASAASTNDFPVTSVYYAFPEFEAAAAGLAEVIGGAEIVLDATYQPLDDPSTEVDEAAAHYLTVIIGLDRIAPLPEQPPA